MKKIAIFPALVIVLAISVSTNAETNREAEQHFEKANELLKHMDYQGAIAEYSKVINISSDSKVAQDAQYWIGQSQFRAGQFDAAQATFAKLIETYPTSAIIPVTKLMTERVEKAKENEKRKSALRNAADKGFFIDPDTGVRYTKIVALAGKNDVIVDTTDSNRLGFIPLSPNGKFLLYGKLVVPLDGSDPFDLVDISATRCTWSPDGTNVAFFAEDAICVVPVSPQTARTTGPVRKLLDGRYKWGAKVSWSPDGQKLTFNRVGNRKQGIHGGDIWILSVQDGSLTQITNDPAPELAPKWSPDGKFIVYAMRKGRLSFWLISAEGGAPRKIVEPGRRCIPFWSPDSKWIFYTLDERIHLFGLDDKQELELIPPGAVGKFFSWSPDGKKMLFYRPSFGYKYNIKVVSAAGGPPFDLGRQITLYPEHSWSPDSRMIVAEGGKEDGRYGVWASPLSGGDPALIEMDVPVEGNPSPIRVSPNAKKGVFSVNRDDGTKDLFVVSISLQDARTTGPAVKIFDRWRSPPGVVSSWSPDGNRFAVLHRGDLWIASSDGDEPVQITKTPEGEHRPAWSPDGNMISYVVLSRTDKGGLYVIPASGGTAKKIPHADRTNAWSPDSKSLVIQSEGMISIVSVADGATQQIAELKDLGLERVFCFSWSPDGRHIACVGQHIEKGDAGPVFVIPIDGSGFTTLAANDISDKYLLHWSPDGKWISYNSQGPLKVRPEGTMWEADFDEILAKASR